MRPRPSRSGGAPHVGRSAQAVVASGLLALGLLAGCGGGGAVEEDQRDVTLTVAAATSMRGALEEIGVAFRAAHPGVEIAFTFDSSARLAAQVIDGAPVDVFVAADAVTMGRLEDEDLIDGEPHVVARNELVIVTKPGNPDGIVDVDDLAGVDVLALCGAEAPCGRYADALLDGAGVVLDESHVTRGQNAGATLAAVADGDAGAGIVYATDAEGAGDAVETVPIPSDARVAVAYLVAPIADAGDPAVATAFVAYVLGDEAQAVLAAHGFLPPT